MNSLSRLESLTERERRLLAGFLGFLGVVFLIGLPLYLRISLASQIEQNDAMLELIQQIEEERPALVNAKDEIHRIEQRYAKKAPALAGFLSSTAEQAGLQIPETQDRATVPHGKTVKERQTRIRMTKVGLLQLSTFLEKLAQSGYAVSIGRLDLQRRSGKPDEYDLEMDVSAFDREEPKKAPPKPVTADEEDDE